MEYTVTDRFLRYVRIDTQADPESATVPSSIKQKNLSILLAKELTKLGIDNELTEEGNGGVGNEVQGEGLNLGVENGFSVKYTKYIYYF